MNSIEEIFFVSNLIFLADQNNNVDFSNTAIYRTLCLNDNTRIPYGYFFELNEKGIINYDEIGEDGFAPIIMCSINDKTKGYLKSLLNEQQEQLKKLDGTIVELNKKITEIFTFNPNRLAYDIKESKSDIDNIRIQLSSNQLFEPLIPKIDEIEKKLTSVSVVVENYEDVYKNIIIPLKKESESGIRQTIKWAIISVIISCVISGIISWLF